MQYEQSRLAQANATLMLARRIVARQKLSKEIPRVAGADTATAS